MANYITMIERVTTELRRATLVDEVKDAINDAVAQAAKDRFYFNLMRAVSFVTVPGQEYYADQGLVEIDAAYYFVGGTRYNLQPENNLYADDRAEGNVISGQTDGYSRAGEFLRLYPVPTAIVTVYLDGYGKLTPYPFTADADTNAWMTTAERYIRTLAKGIILRDVIRNYGEASTVMRIAEDLKDELLLETAQRMGTGTVRPTQF